MTPVISTSASRGATRLAGLLRAQIAKGAIPGGSFLPSVRAFAKEHHVGTKTARLALKVIESEGLAVPEDRRGYRVLARANDPDRGCPLAFVVSKNTNADTPLFYSDLLSALQTAAGHRKWSLLGVQRDGRTVGEVIEHLRSARACGVVVDCMDVDLLDQLRCLGIPVVMADAWLPECRCDAVAQDGFSGGLLASEWLLARGHQRIAFFGFTPRHAGMLTIERFAGAVGGLAHAGLSFDPKLIVHVPRRDMETATSLARTLLARRDRPTAVLALWQNLGLTMARAARDLGLVIGKDLDLVGWTARDGSSSNVMQEFAALGAQAAAVTWSMAELAEVCMVRLMQRRQNPQLDVSLIRVPVRIQAPPAIKEG